MKNIHLFKSSAVVPVLFALVFFVEAAYASSWILDAPTYSFNIATTKSDQVLDRAKVWLDKDYTYERRIASGTHAGKRLAPWNARYYRTDCSGFVSMAWGLTASWSTDEFFNKDSKSTTTRNSEPGWKNFPWKRIKSSAITYSDIKVGDALVWRNGVPDNHVVLVTKKLGSGKIEIAEMTSVKDNGKSGMRTKTWLVSDFNTKKARLIRLATLS